MAGMDPDAARHKTITPNILLLMTDQQRADALGASGGWVPTPHLDGLAAEGMRFSNCITTSPVCVPARLSLATGLYPHHTGVWQNQRSQPSPEQPTWMQCVRAAGYRTSLFGKTHLHPHQGDLREREDLMRSYGLDDVDEIGGPRASARVLSHMTAAWQAAGVWDAYRADYEERFRDKPHMVRPSPLGLQHYADVYVGQQARQYITEYDLEQPWCCWVSFGGPHEPWDTPEPFASLCDPLAMPRARRAPEGVAGRPLGELDRMLASAVDPSVDDIAAMRANYAGNIALIDEQIGQIFAAIKGRGEWENTIVVLVSDHGEMNGDAGLIYKSNFLDGAVRVPLIVRTPEMVEAAVSEALVEWIDIGPTLVEMAGGRVDYPQFGCSLNPVLEDPRVEHRTEVIAELVGEIMLLDHQWKVALNCAGQVYLLFDVQNDPDEMVNLAGRPEMAAVEDRLRLRVLERLVSTQLQGAGYRCDLHGN
ncbi:MAG: sulfatase-like hydrolase/transferase [Gemmatimonadetes bacterium]|nr:sulfatase-like hydrolase/transferase [Gemmatimonadota bacterium]MBT5328519.1 sulfatase-like hydrolase/transferase [Gemmatimonadota bacterium]MBT5452891.1 sulfatase-like hydrolase/transferase [Gemmatimonadota bacterium]MBT5802560.1 sulfatase-like hydrolase/transferase [Gemmatimonadota bacterium]MBT6620153.1 sulfatase-like hydrolase/transferase [Gemmatimonadota bacterium]